MNHFVVELHLTNMVSLNDRAVLNCVFNPLLPTSDIYDEDLSQILQDEEEDSEAGLKAKNLEVEGVKYAESGNVTKAFELFSQAIETAPDRPSGYNNRAQALRLLGRDEEAMKDLNAAIELSKAKGRSGCQAFCQRGLLYRKYGDAEAARNNFTKASALGSNFAKSQLVELNPYAAMCNQMLREVMENLKKETPEEKGGA